MIPMNQSLEHFKRKSGLIKEFIKEMKKVISSN